MPPATTDAPCTAGVTGGVGDIEPGAMGSAHAGETPNRMAMTATADCDRQKAERMEMSLSAQKNGTIVAMAARRGMASLRTSEKGIRTGAWKQEDPKLTGAAMCGTAPP